MNPKLTQAKIAARELVRRASVCQYLRLLHLPVAVRSALLAPNQSSRVLKHFGLRQLLRLFLKAPQAREAEFKRQLDQINA